MEFPKRAASYPDRCGLDPALHPAIQTALHPALQTRSGPTDRAAAKPARGSLPEK